MATVSPKMRAAYKRAHQSIVASAEKAANKQSATVTRSVANLAKAVERSNSKAHSYIEGLAAPEKLAAYKAAQVAAVFSLNKAYKNGPVTADEAKSLRRTILELAGNGFPFDVVSFGVDTASGRIRCYITLLHPKNPSDEKLSAAAKALKATLVTWTLKSDRAARSSSTGLATYTLTSPKHPHLVGVKQASEAFRARHGLTKKPSYHASLYHLGAIESRLSKEPLNPTNEAELFSRIRNIASRDNNVFLSALTSGLCAMFDRELDEMSAVFGNIARTLVKDSRVRAWYAKQVSAIPDTIRIQVQAGKISVERGALLASVLRNELMEEARKKGTSWGKAYAERLKAKGSTYTELIDKNVKKLGVASIADLTPEQRNLIHTEIIDSAGRPNLKEVKLAKIAGKVGQRLWILTFVLAGWAVIEAEDPLQETFRQSVGIGTALWAEQSSPRWFAGRAHWFAPARL